MGGIAGQPQGLPFGVQERKPSESERAFFLRTGIPGYAADDGRVVMNPSDLKGVNKAAVRKNEAARIFLRNNPDFLDFELTKHLTRTRYALIPRLIGVRETCVVGHLFCLGDNIARKRLSLPYCRLQSVSSIW